MTQPPDLRTALRVMKYDPSKRNERGAFFGQDWTSVSDVGASFDGEVLTLQHYLEVEARHLQVVAAFLDEAEVDGTFVRAAETYDARWWPAEGQRLSRLETVDIVREMLRERAFCRLETPAGVYIHVGYDYYLYLGGDVPSGRTIDLATQVGLFVDEDFTSPYHTDPETGEYFWTTP